MAFMLLLINLHHGLVIGDVQRALGEVPPGFTPDRELIPFCRLTSSAWLLHTARPPSEIAARIQPLAATFLLTRIDLDEPLGLLSHEAWTWIDHARRASPPRGMPEADEAPLDATENELALEDPAAPAGDDSQGRRP